MAVTPTGAAPPTLLPPRRGSGLLDGWMNPLTMAGIGMLSQGPSLTPISPFAGASQGMMLGLQAQQWRQRMELARQEAEREAAAQALRAKQMTREEQDAAARAAAIGQLPPHLQTVAAIDPGKAASAYASQMSPEAPTPTTLERNLVAAGLQPGTPEYEAAIMEHLGRSGVTVNNQAAPVFRTTPGGGTVALTPDGQGGWTTTEVVPPQPPGAANIAVAESKAGRATAKRDQALASYRDAVNAVRADWMNPDLRAAAEEARAAMIEAQAQADSPGRAPTDDDRRAAAERVPRYLDFGQITGTLMGGDPFMARLDALQGATGEEPAAPGATPGAAATAATAATAARPVGTQPAQGGTFANAPPVGAVEEGYEFLGGDPADPNSWRRR